MPKSFALFLFIFFAIYGLASYYVAARGWFAFQSYLGALRPFYILLMVLLTAAYPVGRFTEGKFWIGEILTSIGAYWLPALYYLFLFTLLADIVKYILRFTIKSSLAPSPLLVGTVIVSLTALLIVYGIWNARHPVVKQYTIDIPKQASNITELHIVAASDLHLGKVVNEHRLTGFVRTVNALQPDIVLLPGDIIDEDVEVFNTRKMPLLFRDIHSKYGIYAVLGNHEYIGRQPNTAIAHLDQGGVRVLRDQSVTIADAFYVVGRDDLSAERFTGKARLPLSELTNSLDPKRPIILLDHQPYHLEEAEQAGVDLQLSGHTHHGQFFPNSLITKAIYEIDWGYLRKNTLHVLVSCGYGTWGPPIRIGNQPEILDIIVRFTPTP